MKDAPGFRLGDKTKNIPLFVKRDRDL